ncbi:MAG: hypothetical protein GXP08_03395 [Gammaproteobacteria bacterium]|nr:hypothetical protein [Gammaproteobacteria bacterium]
MKRIIIITALIIFSNGVFAQAKFNISPGVKYFNYEETDDNGVFLNKETGFIAGIQGSITQRPDNNSVYASINAGYFDGRIQYDGHTQNGADLLTQTDETFYHAGLTVGENLMLKGAPLAIYTTIEYRQWDRDILATERTLGLFERYKWWELSFGVIHDLIKNTSHNLTLDVSVIRTLSPKMAVDLSAQGFGKPVLDLGSKLGAAIELSYTLRAADNYRIGVAGKYKTWRFGASKTRAVSNGLNSATIIEPSSMTHTAEMRIVIERYF